MEAKIACPHCQAPNIAGSAFCESCGKALPSMYASGPRVLTDKDYATTSAGVKLQSDELKKESKSASNALLTVAILQSIAPFIIVVLMRAAPGRGGGAAGAPLMEPVTIGILGAIAVVFWGLWFWSRSNPLPAAITGLILYITINVVDIAILAMANGGGPVSPLNGIIVKIFIVAMLVRGINAASRHRKLMQQQAQGFPVV